jgi:hypothetical protein
LCLVWGHRIVAIARDCKSLVLRLRWFESNCPHLCPGHLCAISPRAYYSYSASSRYLKSGSGSKWGLSPKVRLETSFGSYRPSPISPIFRNFSVTALTFFVAGFFLVVAMSFSLVRFFHQSFFVFFGWPY